MVASTVTTNFCRLCASTGSLCISVFSLEGDKHLLKHKLRICAPVIVREDDTFPKQVCINCLSRLDQIYDFYQQMKSAQLTLQAIFESRVSNKRRLSSCTDTSGNCTKKQCLLTQSSSEPDEKESLPHTENPLCPPLFVVVEKSSEAEFAKVSRAESSASSNTPTKANNESTNATAASKGEKSTNPKFDAVKAEAISPQSNKGTPSESSELPHAPVSNPPSDSQNSSDTSQSELSTETFEPCPICKRKFTEDSLPDHVKMHKKESTESKYTCNQCPKGFFFKAAYDRHLIKHHPKI